MDKFLVTNDFFTLIQEDNLDEVINNDDILNQSIDSAVEEAAGYIQHRYDFDKAFAIVNTYDDSVAYAVDARIFWTETAWDLSVVYNSGDIISFNSTTDKTKDFIYQANATTIAGKSPLTTPAKWDLLAKNNNYYYVIATTIAGDLPTDTAKFTLGDSRNPKLKEVVIDILLYNIHSRITPRNIPEVRKIRYDGNGAKNESMSAIAWLEKVQKGTVTPTLQVIVDDDGVTPQNTERVSYGQSPNSKYAY